MDLWELPRPCAHLDHRHLSCLALALWEPGVAFVTATPAILYWICVGFKVFSASDKHAPAIHRNGASPPLRSRIALHWSISISLLDLLDGGHCLCTTGCRASPRHELRLRHLVSFRDIRPLSLYHSVYDLNSLRELLDGRHPFLYCKFISLNNCTCVVSTTFLIFRVARHLAVTLSVAQLVCSPLCRIAGN